MKLHYRSRHIFLVSIVCLALLCMTSIAAQSATTFKITIAAASNSGNSIDPKLNKIKAHLAQLRYTNYRYISNSQFALETKDEKSFKITSSIRGTITLKWVKDKRAAFNFKMFSDKKNVDISYSIPIGGRTIVVGPVLSGETYIIIIQALK